VRRGPSALAVAAVGPLVGFVAFSLARGDRRVGAYVLVWAVLATLVALTHARWPLRRSTLWALLAAGWVHLCGGLLPSPDRGAPILYETWIVHGVLKFDQLAHASICAVVTVAVYEVLGRVVDPTQAGPTARAVLAAVVCWGFGAANELFEFLSALRFRDAYVGNLDNTGWDLAFNTLGSLTAAVVLATLASSAARSSALGGLGGQGGHGAVPLPERA
jgi:uncharacterized membrane protein YjdF